MELTKMHNKYPTIKGLDFFYSLSNIFFAVIQVAQNITRVFNGRVRLFVPRFYHDNILGGKLYKYYLPGNHYIRPLNRNNLDWPVPDKFYVSIGYTVHRFSFTFKNAANNLSTILNPSNNLINVESGLKEVENTLIDTFLHCKKN